MDKPAGSPLAARPHVDWRVESLMLALTIGEAAVIWLAADVLLGATRDGVRLAAAPTILTVLTAALVPRWLEQLDVRDALYRPAIVVAVALSTVALIKIAAFPNADWFAASWARDAGRGLALRPNAATLPVWGLVLLSAFAWWRGKHRAEPGPDAALTLLRTGTAVALVAATIAATSRPEGAGRATSAATLAFFAAALTAVALSRLRTDGGGAAGQAGLGPRWLGSLLAPVLAVAIVAVIAAGLLSRDLLDTLLLILAPLIWALSVIFRLVILTMALIAFIIVSPLLWLLSRHPIDFAGIRLNPERGSPREQAERLADNAARVPDAIRYLIAAAVILLLFSGVTRFVMRRRRRPAAGAGEERESVFAASDLLGLLKLLLAPLLPKRSAAAADPLAALRGDPRWRFTITIRETYAHFLVWSLARGAPRAPATTPAEHAARMSGRAGQTAREDLQRLTAIYNATRYDDRPATAEDAAAATAAWDRLRTTAS